MTSSRDQGPKDEDVKIPGQNQSDNELSDGFSPKAGEAEDSKLSEFSESDDDEVYKPPSRVSTRTILKRNAKRKTAAKTPPAKRPRKLAMKTKAVEAEQKPSRPFMSFQIPQPVIAIEVGESKTTCHLYQSQLEQSSRLISKKIATARAVNDPLPTLAFHNLDPEDFNLFRNFLHNHIILPPEFERTETVLDQILKLHSLAKILQAQAFHNAVIDELVTSRNENRALPSQAAMLAAWEQSEKGDGMMRLMTDFVLRTYSKDEFGRFAAEASEAWARESLVVSRDLAANGDKIDLQCSPMVAADYYEDFEAGHL